MPGLDGSTYDADQPISLPCKGKDAIKRTAVCALFTLIQTLFPAAVSTPDRVSAPLRLSDFTSSPNETRVKDVFASAAGQCLVNSFLLYCAGHADRIPPVSEYVRDGKKVNLGARTPLRAECTYAVLSAPGVPVNKALTPDVRTYDVGAALLGA